MCLIVSVFLVGLSTPLIKSVVSQIKLMVPLSVDQSVYRTLGNRHASEPDIVVIMQTLRGLATGQDSPSALDQMERVVPDNGLSRHLRLLPLLRQRASLAEPQGRELDRPIERLLMEIGSGPPVSLPVARERQYAETLLQAAGHSPRAVAVMANRATEVVADVRGSCRPILRELANRLMAYAHECRQARRVASAAAAEAALVRLFTDLANESPTPDLVLLAAEKLPMALRALGADEEAKQVEVLRHRWHHVAQADQINLVPWTGDFSLVPDEQIALLRSLCAVGIAAGTGLTLVVVTMLLVMVVAVTRLPGDVFVAWRFGGAGAWIAAMILCTPLVVGLVYMAFGNVHFTWLMSIQSLGVVTCVPMGVVMMVGLATWLGAAVGEPYVKVRLPAKAVVGFALLLLLLLLAAAVGLPLHRQSWRPPVCIQRLRQLALVFSMASGVVAGAWLLWGFVRRRRAGIPIGTWARATLAVTARAWLLISVVLWVTLVAHRGLDRRHERAFVEAAADPIAARLAPDWRQRHFDPATSFLKSFQYGS